MSDSVFLVDVRRGDAFTRFTTDGVEDIQRILRVVGVGEDLEYLRVERVRTLAEAETVAPE